MGAHLQDGAIPSRYTDVPDEYQAVQTRAGLIDVSHLGLLQITGKDKLSFLNALLPSELSKLKDGSGIHSALLNTKARVLADLFIYARGDDLVVDTCDVAGFKVKDILDRFIITEDVKISDIAPQFVHLTLQGPESVRIMRELLGTELGDLKSLESRMTGPTLVISRDRTGQSGYDIILPNDEAEAVWQGFLLKGITPVGTDALEVLRLEAGYPRYGIDVDENTIILEAGFKDTISFSKGCYLGQEVVARATHIGRVNKNLVQFQTESERVPAPKSVFDANGKDAGYVTSAAFSPGLKAVVGLGYALRDFAKQGTKFLVETELGPLSTTITKVL